MISSEKLLNLPTADLKMIVDALNEELQYRETMKRFEEERNANVERITKVLSEETPQEKVKTFVKCVASSPKDDEKDTSSSEGSSDSDEERCDYCGDCCDCYFSEDSETSEVEDDESRIKRMTTEAPYDVKGSTSGEKSICEGCFIKHTGKTTLLLFKVGKKTYVLDRETWSVCAAWDNTLGLCPLDEYHIGNVYSKLDYQGNSIDIHKDICND